MNKDAPTSMDVARRAGVSQSAVSRVFTPGASVSARTAARVREAADALGYRPNALARSLITGKSRMIGVVMGYLENQFYPDALEKLSRALQSRGYHTLVFMTSNAHEETEQAAQEILDYQVDGVVLASVSASNTLAARCAAAGTPVVLFNRVQDDPQFSTVASDNHAGGMLAAQALIDAGCARISYIAGWEQASTQINREAGLRAALAAAGQELFSRGVGDFHAEDAIDAARDMFGVRSANGRYAAKPADQRPDGLFVANDHMALGVMDMLRYELNLRIPEDVSVIGYDDAPPARWPSYNLTTIRQPSARMVAATVDLLLERIAKPKASGRRVMVDGFLVARGSVRRPGGAAATSKGDSAS